MSGPSLSLFLLADENRWTGLIWLLILVLPVVGRVLRALLGKVGLLQEQASEAAARKAAEGRAEPRADRDVAREEQRRRESEGEELWRRLMQGEEASPRPVPPVAVPARSSESLPQAIPRGDEVTDPRPLSVMGEVSEPAEAAEVSLETAGEPEPLAALAQLPAALEARKRLALRPQDLRKAMLFSEVFGLPLALRGFAHRDSA